MTAKTTTAVPLAPRSAPVYSYTAHGNLYLNLTNRCTLRCGFCPKFNLQWVVDGADLRLREEPNAEQILAAVDDPTAYQEIVFCGLGEPTLRLPVLLEVARELKARGARTRLNTDGLANLVHGRDVTPEFAGLIDAVSISLNAQDASTYERHCRPQAPGSHEAVLEFARVVRQHVPDVMLTAIAGLPGVDINACSAIALELGVEFRTRFLDQVG